MGCSQTYGSHLAIDYIKAPTVLGVPKWDPSFGNTNFLIHSCFGAVMVADGFLHLSERQTSLGFRVKGLGSRP